MIGEKKGSVFVPALTQLPIFAGGFEVGTKTPTYATLTFGNDSGWYMPPTQAERVKLTVNNATFGDMDTGPILTARIANNSLYLLERVPVSVLLYDASNTVIGASETIIDRLEAGKQETVVFTWQRPFEVPVVVKDIQPRFNPFSIR